MAVVTLIFALVTFAVVFWLPGLLALEALAPGKYAGARVGLALAVGIGLVSYVSLAAVGFLGLFFPVYMTRSVIGAVVLLVALVSLVILRHRAGSLRTAIGALVGQVKDAFDWRLGLFLMVIALLYLLAYDGAAFDQERCISRACLLPLHRYLLPNPPLYFEGCLDCFEQANAFFNWNGHQRMGPSVLVAPFVSLFGLPGFRFLHAVLGLLTAWSAYHIGREKLGHAGYGYAAAMLLAANPWALSISLVDENIMALALGSTLLYLLLARRTQWVLVGLFFGLFIGIRHIGLLSLPALIFAVWFRGPRPHYSALWYHRFFGAEPFANVTTLLLSIGLFSAPWLYVHIRGAMLGLPIYESFAGLPPVPHSFLGMEFTLHGLLNWPFIAYPLRSPFNGFPNLIALPVQVVATVGLVGLSALLLGLYTAWRRAPRPLLFALLWTGPQWALLLVMANWVEPNKAGIFLCFLQPIVIGILMGVQWTVERCRDRRFAAPGLVTLATVMAGGGLLLALPGLNCPVDARSLQARPSYAAGQFPVPPPMMLAGESTLAAADRHRLTGLHVLPSPARLPWLSEWRVLRTRAAQLYEDLASPTLARYCPRPKDWLNLLSGIPHPRTGKTVSLAAMMHRPVTRFTSQGLLPPTCPHQAADGPSVSLTLDLTDPLSAEPPLTLASAEAAANYPDAGPAVLHTSFGPLSWSRGEPVHAAVVPGGPGEFWLFVWYGRYRFDHLDGDERFAPLPRAGKTTGFNVPAGTLVRVVNVSSVVPNRFHVTYVPADQPEAATGPYPTSY